MLIKEEKKKKEEELSFKIKKIIKDYNRIYIYL